MSLSIAELDLYEPVAGYAQELLDAFPSIIFTSGRRSLPDQAHAMASNVVLNRRWIAQTYTPSVVSVALQNWVDAHPSTGGVDSIAAGLLAVLGMFSDDDLSHLSLHLSGCAFDVQPVGGLLGEQICAFMQQLANKYPGGKFLSKEGGLTRFHIQWRL